MHMRQGLQTTKRKSNPQRNALSLSYISSNDNQKGKGSNSKNSSHQISKYSLFLPSKVDLQRFHVKRNTDKSRFESISQPTQSPSKNKLIKENQFTKYSQLIEYYSKNVFNPSFTSIRFPSNRYNRHPTLYSHQEKDICIQQQFPLSQSRRQERSRGNASSLHLTRRPNTRSKFINFGMLAKIKKSGLHQLAKNTVEVTHIQKLKNSQTSPSQNPHKAFIKASSQCMLLKGAKKKRFSSIQVNGEHLQSIDPWEFEFDKVKNIADLQIVVKI